MRVNSTAAYRAGIAVAVVAMLVLGTLELVRTYNLGPLLAGALSAVRAVPLLLVRRRPILAWWLAFGSSFAVTAATWLLGYWYSAAWPWTLGSMALLVPLTGVLAAQGRRAYTVSALALITIAGSWLAFALPITLDWLSAGACAVLCAAAAALGDTVHSRRQVAGELAEEKQASSAERARLALVEERTRIARELHDVVAHHMSMITVQAETARYRLAGLPEPVAGEFSGIAGLARNSLTELRDLLTALRDEHDAPALAPQPTLADLDELAARITAAGTPVRLAVTGDVAEDARRAAAVRVPDRPRGTVQCGTSCRWRGHGGDRGRGGRADRRDRQRAAGHRARRGRRRPRTGRAPGAGHAARRHLHGRPARRRLAYPRGAADSPGALVITVVVVDDQDMVRAGFAALLDAQDGIEVIGQAASGGEALAVCAATEPDVVLMDVRMPGLDGVEATARLLRTPTRARVVMLTTFDVDDYVYAALRAGASGFLLKDATPDELVSAVRVVAAGEGLLAPTVTGRLIARFATAPGAVGPPPALDALTPREREVLVLIARGLSNKEIAARLVVAEQTVKTHVGRILGKLALRDRAQAVMAAYESGLVAPGVIDG